MIVLIINCGSSSLRVQLVNAKTHDTLSKCLVERIGAVSSIATCQDGDGWPQRHGLQAPNHTEALRYVLNHMPDNKTGALVDIEQIQAVGHRVVHGGEDFNSSVLIDERVIDSIKQAFDLAPLHSPANLDGIVGARELLPGIPHVAIFDTAFHQTLPEQAYLYAIPYRLYRRYKIRRYGFPRS